MIPVVVESKNFDFEKSGKSFNRHEGKWLWLCEAESDESEIEAIEIRDASSSVKDIECESTSSESESFESSKLYSKFKSKISHLRFHLLVSVCWKIPRYFQFLFVSGTDKSSLECSSRSEYT